MPHRLIVLTDISSLTPGLREPDDGQSMVRLMLYSSEIEIEGLVASSNMGHGQATRPELIHEVVRAYGQVQPSLARHDPRYPAAETLAARIRGGQPVAGPKTPVQDSIGPGKDTPASELIQEAMLKEDPRPLWIAVWGGPADLAQALWQLRESYPQPAVQAALRRVRVHSIADQDTTGPWIKAEFPGLYYITRTGGFRGMYRGGDTALSSWEWVERHIKGHGPLGELYPNYQGGDIFGSTGVRGIKEGDTPSYLGLIANGLNPGAEPTWGDWGGRCVLTGGSPLRLEDAVDPLPGYERDPLPPMATVYRWRPDFQADFQARLDWCVAPPPECNHPPLALISSGALRTARAGETISLDAAASRDPAGRGLRYAWSVYAGAGSLDRVERPGPADQPVFEFRIPNVQRPETLHILLTLTNDGEPPLKSYARVVFQVNPS